MNLHNEEVVIEGLESSIEVWMLGDMSNAVETFGEDVISAIEEVLGHD